MVECEKCSGTGLDTTDNTKLCPACKGSGHQVKDDSKDKK